MTASFRPSAFFSPHDSLRTRAGQQYPAAALYVVATPIGNVADITLRAPACALRLVHRIAAEDTHNTGQLLARYGIRPLIAVHQHNERAAAQRIVEHLQAGERVSMCRTRGTPGTIDPASEARRCSTRSGLCSHSAAGRKRACNRAERGGRLGRDVLVPRLSSAESQSARRRTTGGSPIIRIDAGLLRSAASHRRNSAGFGRCAGRQAQAADRARTDEVTRSAALRHPGRRANVARRRSEPATRGIRTCGGRCAAEAAGEHDHDALLETLLEELTVSSAAKIAATITRRVAQRVVHARARAQKKRTDARSGRPQAQRGDIAKQKGRSYR